METREREWKQWRPMVVYIVWFYMCMDLYGALNNAHTIANETQATFCQAQCEALRLDFPTREIDCSGPYSWYSTCYEPVCEGTCTLFKTGFDNNRDKLPNVPRLNISLSGFRGMELSWPHGRLSSNFTTIYIIEESKPIPDMTFLSSYKIVGWVRDNRYRINGFEACSSNSYRIMAINRYGTSGFSDSVKAKGLRPGKVKNIHYSGAGIYFYQDKDPTVSRFMAILQWQEPAGWNPSEIQYYEWNPMTPHQCLEMSQNSLPLFHRMENQTKHVLMTIAAMSIGCTFKTQVRAVSACNETGPWTDFTVDLTDCNQIVGYKCQDEMFNPPGNVDNVSLSIVATPLSAIRKFFLHPFTINPATTNPFIINLHVHWDEPSDLGSEKLVERYIIRSGPVQMNFIPIPPTFIGTPSVRNLSGNIRDLIFQLPTSKMPYTYGVQILAVAPDQKIPDNVLGIIPVYTIQVARNDSLAQLQQNGKILLDEGGIVIVFINNTMPVSLVFDQPIGKVSNYTVNRYALQWGPLVGPNSNEMMVENQTIVPLETQVLALYLKEPHKRYGIKVRGLSEEQEDPNEEVWDDIPLYSFSLPLEIDEIVDERTHGSSINRFIPLYVTAPIILGIICVAMFLRHLHKQQHNFKHLERRLAEDIDVDSETGDHYFIMRTAGNQVPDLDEQVTTVVTDRWELPHTCIKVGRVLGSGAFGQVVKGRVSRSVLQSRGIDLHNQRAGQGMHVTVAVKMLQECPEERYSNDFLREIKMMKDIGYHRNIVSMLGCCTLREPFCLVVEHVPNGDLLTFLRKIRNAIQQKAAEFGSYVNQEVEMFSPHTLLSYARQIVTGMEYLSQKGFVHRDLAARNILVGDNSTVKIADFGLARYIYYDVGKVYVNRNGGKLPVKWMAPESIFNQIFSTASDVWSFGILLFEIVTLGAIPYPDLSHTDLLQALKQDYIMEKPHNCSDEVYDIMKHCWNYIPGCRPNFSRLREIFTYMLEEDSGIDYFDFKVHEDRLYYRINSDELDTDDNSTNCHTNDDDNDDDGNNDKTKTEQGQAISSQVVFELSCDSITIDDISEPSKNKEIENDPMSIHTWYSDETFNRNVSTTSSFHNELYGDMEDDRIVGISPKSTSVVLPKNSEEETNQGEKSDMITRPVNLTEDFNVDTTSGTDDVFEDCHGCHSKQKLEDRGIRSFPCKVCCKLNLELNDFNIHVSERIDSAIGSDNSSGRYHTDSSNSSVNSNEYLMPDSPHTNSIENDFESLDSDEYLRRELDIEIYPRLVYDYYFINLNRNGDIMTDNKLLSSIENETYSIDNTDASRPTTAKGNRKCNFDRDIWSIAETKL